MECWEESTPFPPEAPMATRSPGLKSSASVMVLCTSVSKTLKKQSLHICCPVFGRLRNAFAFWQRAQLFGAIVYVYLLVAHHFREQVELNQAHGPASPFDVTERTER